MITTSGIKPIWLFLGLCGSHYSLPEIGYSACYGDGFKESVMICELEIDAQQRVIEVEQKLSDEEYEAFFQKVRRVVH